MKRVKYTLLMLRLTAVLLLCFFFLFSLSAQTNSEQWISEIRFEGLTRTKASYLQQFIQSQEGSLYQASLVEEDIQSLINVESIGAAKYRIEQAPPDQIILVFELTEVKTLLPIINFGGIKGNFWYQLGFSDNNWNGKGRNIQVYYQSNDKRHNGQLFYREPFIKGGPWGFTASLFKYSSIEPLFFSEGTVHYDYDNYSFGTSLIRHFGLRRNLEAGGTFFIENYKQSADQLLENPPGPKALKQPKILSKLLYREDHRDYDFFYLKGNDWVAQLQNVYNLDDQSWFVSFISEYRHFWRLGRRVNFALRGRLGFSTNTFSPFAPFVADSYVNLRGVGNRIDRGTAQVVINFEYRQTLFDHRQWAAQAVLFSDLGSWRNPGGSLGDLFDSDQFREFAGGGFRLIYKRVYGAVLRIDYGLDIFNRSQRGLVLGFGQYF